MIIKTLCLILAFIYPVLNGCLGLAIKEDDSAGEITGKVIARTFLALPTLGLSEAKMARIKDEQEGRAWMVTSGSHLPVPDSAKANPQDVVFVVWGNDLAAVSRVTEFLQRNGHPVVERSRLDTIFDEQKITLMHTSEDMPALLRVGQMVGAARIAFVDVKDTPETRSGTIHRPGMILPVGGMWIATAPHSDSYSVTLHHVRVAIRTVKVDDGTIRWSGTATTDKPINNPDVAIGLLTDGALHRALCPVEKGYEWVEQGPWRTKWGCKPPE